MESKQRILNAIKGKEIDRLPWSPFLAYFWDFVDDEMKKMGDLQFLKSIGADPLMRGSHSLFDIKWNNVQHDKKTVGDEQFETITTPVGKLHKKFKYSKNANSWFLVDHPVRTIEECKILQYIYENVSIEKNHERFENDYKKIQNDALLLPIIGVDCKTAFQSVVEHWFGTVEATYAVYDYPEILDECLSVMQEKNLQTVNASIDSSADGFIFWEDSSTTNVSPEFFKKYIAPEMTAWADIVHKNDKFIIHHACGHLKDLMPLIAKTNMDMIESISPPPTGNIEIWEASKLVPDNIGFIGGIEPTVFLNSGMEEFIVYVKTLISNMKGKRFVLANSDSCPPYVSLDKFRIVRKIIDGEV